jgi:hypothetical protein
MRIVRPDEFDAAAIKAARDLRNEFREKGEFSVVDYRSALAARLPLPREEIDALAAAIDRESLQSRPGKFNLEGEFKLDDTQRVAKALAGKKHLERLLKYRDGQTAVIERTSKKMHRACEEFLRTDSPKAEEAFYRAACEQTEVFRKMQNAVPRRWPRRPRK